MDWEFRNQFLLLGARLQLISLWHHFVVTRPLRLQPLHVLLVVLVTEFLRVCSRQRGVPSWNFVLRTLGFFFAVFSVAENMGLRLYISWGLSSHNIGEGGHRT